MAKKIIIYNTWTYYGGTLALSTLCKTLRELGYDASLIFVDPFPSATNKKVIDRVIKVWYLLIKRYILHIILFLAPNTNILQKSKLPQTTVTSIKGIKRHFNPFSVKNNIVVYPEFIYKNPLFAKNVVRWFLYNNRFMPEEKAFGEKDLFIAYREVFNDPTLNPEHHIVNIKYFDSTLYRQYNFKERKGNCYILRKGKLRQDLPTTFDGPCFDDNMSQEELVKMFNEHKFCYSYDTQTFYCKIAAVCGCLPIVLLEPGKTIDDYLSEEEKVKHYGVAYGNTPDQIEYAIKTRELLLESLNFDESNRLSALKFVEIVERRFGKIKRI